MKETLRHAEWDGGAGEAHWLLLRTLLVKCHLTSNKCVLECIQVKSNTLACQGPMKAPLQASTLVSLSVTPDLNQSFPPDNHSSRTLNKEKTERQKGRKSQPKLKWKYQKGTKENSGQNIHRKSVHIVQRKLAALVVGVLHRLICSQSPYLPPPDSF